MNTTRKKEGGKKTRRSKSKRQRKLREFETTTKKRTTSHEDLAFPLVLPRWANSGDPIACTARAAAVADTEAALALLAFLLAGAASESVCTRAVDAAGAADTRDVADR